MNKLSQFATILFLIIGFTTNAQNIVWTGSTSNNDFFDENNWLNSVTNLPPVSGSIEPAVTINLPLIINNYGVATIIANGNINIGSGSLVFGNANLKAQSFSGTKGKITLNEGGYIELTDSDPFRRRISAKSDFILDITSGIGWVKTANASARKVEINNATFQGEIRVNGMNPSYGNNLRLDNYYRLGCIIRSNAASTTPLTIFDNTNLEGNSALITVNTIHRAGAIANDMNNKMESFLLKKGFMVTIAIENDGTGSSKNYIASETDLVINNLPKLLQNDISFIRVLPWNWVTKKGVNDPSDITYNASWRYQWNPTEVATTNWEFTPMSWGHGTTSDAGIESFVTKSESPYLLSFNEPDDCDGQSGQYPSGPIELRLCNIDVAVAYHKNLMKTGMRIVSPAGREEAPFGWLQEFHEKATAENVRIDVLGIHWYDWSAVLDTNLNNDTAAQAFVRFKAYLTRVHDYYKLPIWITEFNANPARSQEVNAEFLSLALPYLESLDYIERYCWFPFNSTTHFSGWADKTPTKERYELNEIISLVGTIYKNINNTTPTESTPSVPESVIDANNNLNLVTFPNIALNKTATANSFFDPELLSSNVVDGNTTSASSLWQANIKRPTESNYAPLPAWIEVDLQGSFTIDSFRITESSSPVKDFNFEVWDSSLNSGSGGWRTALIVTGNPATSLTTFKTISPVTTTKVRLYITDHYSSTFIRIFELEVYGKSVETLGTKQFVKQAFSIYPNPISNGIINIVGDQEVFSAELFNISGAKMDATLENGTVSVQNLSSGVYFLKINKFYTIKFIKP